MSAVLKQALGILLLLVIAIASSVSFTLVVGALVVYSLLGPVQIIQTAALALVLKYINPAFVNYDSAAGLLFWLLVLSSGLRALPFLKRVNSNLISIWVFSLIAIVVSAISSPALMVSVMKVITFVWISTTILLAFSALTKSDLQYIKGWLGVFAAVVILGSAATLLRPSIGHHAIPGSLQGIFNQPQSLGIFAAPIAAYTLSSVLLMRSKTRSMEIAAMAIVWLVMLLTLARTAAVAAIGAVLVALLTRLVTRQRMSTQAGAAHIVAYLILGVMSIVVIDVATGKVEDAVNSFVLKRKSGDVNASFYASRGWGIVSQWQNFIDRPLSGHGFGVYANGEFPKGIVEIAGIPISAPVEKGFLPTAILEETGVVGTSLFIWMVGSLAFAVWKNADPRWIAAFWAAILINLGEAALLSPGGIGLYMWLVIGLCIASGSTASEEQSEVDDIEPAPVPRVIAANLMH